MSTIADNIKALREKAGYTQETFADAIEVNRVTLSKYETGLSVPGAHVVKRMAQVLHVSSDVILGNGLDDMSDEELELLEVLEAARRDPDRRVLLQLAKGGTAKDVKQAVALIDALKATNPEYYDGDDPA